MCNVTMDDNNTVTRYSVVFEFGTGVFSEWVYVSIIDRIPPGKRLPKHKLLDFELKQWRGKSDPVVVSERQDAEALIAQVFNDERRFDMYSLFRVYTTTVTLDGKLVDFDGGCDYSKDDPDDPNSAWWHVDGQDLLGKAGVNLNA